MMILKKYIASKEEYQKELNKNNLGLIETEIKRSKPIIMQKNIINNILQ